MPTIISHGIAAVAIGKVFTAERMPARFWTISVICAMLPDIDVVGFAFGIRYSDMLGHRGLTHSFAFAFLVGCVAAWIMSPGALHGGKTWFAFIVYFFIVTASHGLLDAMTNGGLGIAFFAPFSNTRYFFPWRPIEVSPLGLDVFFSSPLPVLWSEIKWILVPSALLITTAQLVRTTLKK